MNDLPSRLALLRTHLPTDQIHHLLNQLGTASDAFKASTTTLEKLGLSANDIDRLQTQDHEGVDRDLAWLEHPGHYIIGHDSPAFPKHLLNILHPPYILYAIGDLDYLNQPQLAMVGSRNPSAAGNRTATDFAQHLSSAGLTITSGLAIGIDTACHQGALQGLAGSVAVVANGLNRIYPKTNTQLAESLSQNGCIISESPIGTAPHKHLFAKRNRLISGLSIGTLVVEAAINSGSLITARHAMEQGKEVFAIPGSIHNPLSKGCHSLIKQGAKLVETAQDILEELLPLVKLPSSSHTSAQIDETPSTNGLDPAYQTLLGHMGYEPASIDELVERSKMKAADIASMILILELQGHVVSKNGRYTRVESGL